MSNLKKLLEHNDFSFKKKFGQNFLKDENILTRIVEESEVDDKTIVIEIGVGAGVLTKKLASKCAQVIGYEIDKTLQPIIDTNLQECKNINIIYEDFLTRDIKKDLETQHYDKLYVVANLPYYITTPIITKIIELDLNVEKIVIMIQKEVADRFAAKPGSKDYNSLTIFIQYFYDVKKLFQVDRTAFMPMPNVDSTVLALIHNKRYQVINEEVFFKLVKDSFHHKRKTLKNNLTSYPLEKIEDILKKYHMDLTTRAEQISIEIFVEIANRLAI